MSPRLGAPPVDPGDVRFDFDTSVASPGAATIDKPIGQSAVASGVATVTITNNLVSAQSTVLAVTVTSGQPAVKRVTPAAGSFVIELSANATADATVAWVVFSPT